MKWVYDDGGRSKYFRGKYAGDCFVRAVAIATDMDYKEVYNLVNEYGKKERPSIHKKDKSTARNGVYRGTARKIMKDLGWTWVPYSLTGHMLHLNTTELPSTYTIVCCLARHVVCVKSGVIHDVYDSSNKSINFFYRKLGSKPVENHKDRLVYGYWYKK